MTVPKKKKRNRAKQKCQDSVVGQVTQFHSIKIQDLLLQSSTSGRLWVSIFSARISTMTCLFYMLLKIIQKDPRSIFLSIPSSDGYLFNARAQQDTY